MTREPLAYPGDPYNDPDYDEVAILKGEIERLRAESEAFRGKLAEQCGQTLVARAEIERLRAALESLTKDPPATLDEPDTDAEVIIKMRAIAQGRPGPQAVTMDYRYTPDEIGELNAVIDELRAEVEEWKERWAAERRDHETTIRHFDTLINETP